MRPEDLSPDYRRLYESFVGLGMSESAAMTAATCREMDRPGHGPTSHAGTFAERSAAMFVDPGVAVEEAFGRIGASMLGHEFGTEAGARQSFSEALRAGSVERHPSTVTPPAPVIPPASPTKPAELSEHDRTWVESEVAKSLKAGVGEAAARKRALLDLAAKSSGDQVTAKPTVVREVTR